MISGQFFTGINENNLHKTRLSVIIPIQYPNKHIDNLLRLAEDALNSTIRLIYVFDCPSYINVESIVLKKLTELKVKVVIDSFGNAGQARNAGLSLADSDWIAFWDSDDMFDLNLALEALRIAPEDSTVVIGGFQVLEVCKGFRREVEPPITPSSLARNPGIWRMMFRKELLKDITFPSIKLAEDQVFLCRTLCQHPKVFFTPLVWYRYAFGLIEQTTTSSSKLLILKSQIQAVEFISTIKKPHLDSCYACESMSRIQWRLSGSAVVRILANNRLYNRIGIEYLRYAIHNVLQFGLLKNLVFLSEFLRGKLYAPKR